MGVSVTSVILSASTVPGTTLPTQAALSGAFTFIDGTALLGLLLALLIGGHPGRGRGAASEPAQVPAAEAGSKEAAI
jgi:hypothetical protein